MEDLNKKTQNKQEVEGLLEQGSQYERKDIEVGEGKIDEKGKSNICSSRERVSDTDRGWVRNKNRVDEIFLVTSKDRDGGYGSEPERKVNSTRSYHS